jgi:large subunit ribosomal protein L13
MRSTTIVKASDVTRAWYIVDAQGHTLGRLASEIAKVLRGKNKPTFSTFIDTGDYVIVVNAEKIKVTGKKLDQKIYKRNSGWVGGLKEIPMRQIMEKKPEEALIHAIKGMLPKNALGDQMFKKLRVYKGPDHDHAAQKPEPLEITY